MEYGLGEFSESEEKGINHSKPNLFLSLPVEAPAAFRGFSTSLLALLLFVVSSSFGSLHHRKQRRVELRCLIQWMQPLVIRAEMCAGRIRRYKKDERKETSSLPCHSPLIFLPMY